MVIDYYLSFCRYFNAITLSVVMIDDWDAKSDYGYW